MAHTIKVAADNVGAMAVAKIPLDIESAAEKGNIGELSNMFKHLDTGIRQIAQTELSLSWLADQIKEEKIDLVKIRIPIVKGEISCKF